MSGIGSFLLLADAGDAAAGILGCGFMIFYLAFIVLAIAGMWKMFVKAGKPGWAAIVPIYNLVVLCEIAGKPLWWVACILCAPVWLVMSLFIWIEIAKKFGKGTGFAVGLWLLTPIFAPILGFGSATFNANAT
jgi:hypothetical protein